MQVVVTAIAFWCCFYFCSPVPDVTCGCAELGRKQRVRRSRTGLNSRLTLCRATLRTGAALSRRIRTISVDFTRKNMSL